MTVDIAAICENGNAIVAMSDMKRTFGNLFEVEIDSPKVFEFSKNCLVMHAGAGDSAHEMCLVANKNAESTEIKEIADILKNVYKWHRGRFIEDALLSKYNINWEAYTKAQNGMQQALIMNISEQLMRYNHGVEFLTTGIDKSGAHIHNISDPGVANCFDKNGYWAIGSGMQFAITTLAMNSYTTRVPLKKALYDVFEAKKASEIAVGVGTATDAYLITRQDGIKHIDSDVLKELDEMYNEKTKGISKISKDLETRVNQINL